MITKQNIPLFIVLGLLVGSVVITLITYFISDPDDDLTILLSIMVGIGFLGVSLGVIAFYGLIKAIYKKQLRALISWVVLIAVYFILGFVFKFSGTGSDSGAMGIFYIGLMIMGGNELWKIWKTRKTKSNNQ